MKNLALVSLAVLMLVAACAPQALSPGASSTGQQPPVPKKRITASALGNITVVASFIADGSIGANQPGIAEVEKMVHVGLTQDVGGVREPRLAEIVPTTDNGLWRVLPDGKMEITWKLRADARWHDGTPVTAQDMVFTARMAGDSEIMVARNVVYSYVEAIETPDERTDLYIRTGLAAADYWKRIGIDASSSAVPDARESDREFRATFPGFEAVQQGSGISALNAIKRAEVPLPENDFRGRNRSRYVNPELESLIDRYYITIPMRERLQTLSQIVNRLTSNAVYLWLFYGGQAMAIGNRLVNVAAATDSANAHAWDIAN